MNAQDQLVLAQAFAEALRAAGWEIAEQKQRDGRSYCPPADPVAVLGAIYRARFVMHRIADAPEAPAWRPRLVRE